MTSICAVTAFGGWLAGQLGHPQLRVALLITAFLDGGATDQQFAEARALQRKAQRRTDFINAENSMGFHAPQEAARILAEAIDYSPQRELAVLKATAGSGLTRL